MPPMNVRTLRDKLYRESATATVVVKATCESCGHELVQGIDDIETGDGSNGNEVLVETDPLDTM